MTTDRPALTDEDHEPLSDAVMDRIQSHAETWREMHDVAPEELMDIDLLLTEARRARAEASRLRAELASTSADLAEAHELLASAEHHREKARAENTAQAARLAAIRELRRSWFQNADVVRGKSDSIPGLTEVERAELRQGAVEMEHCARQVGFELGPTPEEEPGFVSKDLGRRERTAAALGGDQDGGTA